MLHISYKDHVTNGKVCAKIQQAIRPHEDLTITKRCKLQWCRHVSHSSGLDKTILQGRHRESGKKTRQTEEEVRRQHYGMDWPGVRQVPEGSGGLGKQKEKNGCKSICGASTTLEVKG